MVGLVVGLTAVTGCTFVLVSVFEPVLVMPTASVPVAGVVVTCEIEFANVFDSFFGTTATAGVLVACFALLTYTALPVPMASRAMMARIIRGAMPRFICIMFD